MADKAFGVDQLDILGTGTPTISAPNQLNLDCHTVAISTSVTVGANLTVNGNIDLGNASSDTISLTGVVDTNIIPSADSSKDIGSNSVRFANGYFDTVYGSGANLTNLPTIAGIWSVGHNGASNYVISGPGGLSSANNPDLYLERGKTYQFVVNASGHGFGIQTSSGTWNSSNAYTTGITNAGAATGTITFAVPYSAPARLYYACTSQHSGMVGNLYIQGAASTVDVSNNADNRVITGGSGASLNGEANLTFNSSLVVTDGNGTVTTGGNYINLKRTSANTNYINAPLANAELVISADENLLFHTVHTGDFNSTERLRIDSSGFVGINDSAPEVRFHVRENTGDGSSRTLAMFQKNHTSTSLSGNMASNGYPHALILENQDTSSDQGLSSLCFSKYTSGSQSQAVIAGISESAGNMALTFNTESSNTIGERLRIASDGNLFLQPTNMGTGSLYPYMNVLNGQIKKYMQMKVLNSGQGTKFTFTGTDRTSALITIKVSHSWTASNTGNRHGSAIFAAKFFTQSGGSAGWGGITLIQSDGYSTGNFILSNESGFGYSIKVNNPLGDSGVTFCYDIEVMSATNTSKHSLTSVTVV